MRKVHQQQSSAGLPRRAVDAGAAHQSGSCSRGRHCHHLPVGKPAPRRYFPHMPPRAILWPIHVRRVRRAPPSPQREQGPRCRTLPAVPRAQDYCVRRVLRPRRVFSFPIPSRVLSPFGHCPVAFTFHAPHAMLAWAAAPPIGCAWGCLRSAATARFVPIVQWGGTGCPHDQRRAPKHGCVLLLTTKVG